MSGYSDDRQLLWHGTHWRTSNFTLRSLSTAWMSDSWVWSPMSPAMPVICFWACCCRLTAVLIECQPIFFSGNFPLSMKWALLRPTHGCFRAAIAVLRTPVLVAGQEWIASRLITQNQQRGVVRPTDTQFVVGAGRWLSEQDLVFDFILIACRFPPPRQKSFKAFCRCDESVNFNHPSMHCRALPPSDEF